MMGGVKNHTHDRWWAVFRSAGFYADADTVFPTNADPDPAVRTSADPDPDTKFPNIQVKSILTGLK
jgi:hypothetical protein